MSPTVTTRKTKQKEVIWQQYRLCPAVAEYQFLGCEHFMILEPESKKNWLLKKLNTICQSISASGLSCVARNPVDV